MTALRSQSNKAHVGAQVGCVIDGCDRLTHPCLAASRKWLGGLMARGCDRLKGC